MLERRVGDLFDERHRPISALTAMRAQLQRRQGDGWGSETAPAQLGRLTVLSDTPPSTTSVAPTT